MSVVSLIVRIALVVFVTEAIIMIGFTFLPPIESKWLAAGVDGVMLTLMSALPLLFWVVLPCVRNQKHSENMAEEAHHKIERRLSQVLEAVVDGIITSDEKGKIQIFNQAAEKIFGYQAEEVIGQSINMLMPHKEASEHDKYFENYNENSSAIVGFSREVMGKRKDGTDFPIDLAISQLEIDGELMFTGVVRDITQRKKSEHAQIEAKNEAERANRVKSEFMANMSHELRTPLNAIIGFSEVISAEMFGPLGHGKYHEYIGDVKDSAEHLLDLINDILDMSRIESGKFELHDEAFDLLEISQAPLSCVKADKITLINKIPSDFPLLYADKRRVKQILLNLLSNAVKFTLEGGSVEIGVRLDAFGGIVLSVSDTGIGMSKDEIECALRPFEQIDTGLNRKYEGTGLGLPLVDRLAKLNSGGLKIISTPGQGTCAEVHFSKDRTVARDQSDMAHKVMS